MTVEGKESSDFQEVVQRQDIKERHQSKEINSRTLGPSATGYTVLFKMFQTKV